MKYFKESEFYCPCGCGLNIDDMDEDVVRDLDIARSRAGLPFVLTSTVRCKAYNATLKNASKTSSHPDGYAVDILCESSYHRFKIVTALMSAGFTRIGIGANFIHADKDPFKPKELIWRY